MVVQRRADEALRLTSRRFWGRRVHAIGRPKASTYPSSTPLSHNTALSPFPNPADTGSQSRQRKTLTTTSSAAHQQVKVFCHSLEPLSSKLPTRISMHTCLGEVEVNSKLPLYREMKGPWQQCSGPEQSCARICGDCYRHDSHVSPTVSWLLLWRVPWGGTRSYHVDALFGY